MLYHLLYVSRASHPMSREALEAIIESANQRNATLGVTGLLLYSAGHFMQLLEGEFYTLNELYDRIRRDVRHREVSTLLTSPTQSRLFGDWSMGLLNLDTAGELDRERLEAIRRSLQDHGIHRGQSKTALSLLREFRRQLSPPPGAAAPQAGDS